MWGFIIALVSGALMSIQGVFNTEVTKQTSIWVSSGWVQFSAFIACVIMWFFTGRNEVGGLFQVYAGRRCHGRPDYLYRYKECGYAGPG